MTKSAVVSSSCENFRKSGLHNITSTYGYRKIISLTAGMQ